MREQSPEMEQWLALAVAVGAEIVHKGKCSGFESWILNMAVPHPWGTLPGALETLELKHGAVRGLTLRHDGSVTFAQIGVLPGEHLGPLDPFRLPPGHRIVLFVSEAAVWEDARGHLTIRTRGRVAVSHFRSFNALVEVEKKQPSEARAIGLARVKEVILFYRAFMASQKIPACDLFNRLEAWASRKEAI